jgi:hypothetical protein
MACIKLEPKLTAIDRYSVHPTVLYPPTLKASTTTTKKPHWSLLPRIDHYDH